MKKPARPIVLRYAMNLARKQLFIALAYDEPGFRFYEYNTVTGARLETPVYTAEQIDRCFEHEGL